MASIYLHIPFCRKMCGYCDFFKSARTDKLDRTVDVMMEELESERDFLSTRNISTIYFGGGTPSLLSPRQVEQFIDRIASLYDVSMVEEITLEANPDDLTQEYINGLRQAGINRLSIGIQSFDDDTLKFMNRRHSAQQAIEAVKSARDAGFDNIAIDLIFGVSGFGGEKLSRSIEQAVELDVEHIAAYHLTIESGTMFARRVAKGEFKPVDESISEQEYELVRQSLTSAGYNHYEISNYAREGRESKHNSAYWSGAEYLGIGAGAHSFSNRGDWGERRWSAGGLDLYLGNEYGDRYQSERLTEMERRNEIVMTSLRRTKGLNIERFTEMFGVEQREQLLSDARNATERGDIVKLGEKNERIVIPCERFLKSDMIIEELFSL